MDFSLWLCCKIECCDSKVPPCQKRKDTHIVHACWHQQPSNSINNHQIHSDTHIVQRSVARYLPPTQSFFSSPQVGWLERFAVKQLKVQWFGLEKSDPVTINHLDTSFSTQETAKHGKTQLTSSLHVQVALGILRLARTSRNGCPQQHAFLIATDAPHGLLSMLFNAHRSRPRP